MPSLIFDMALSIPFAIAQQTRDLLFRQHNFFYRGSRYIQLSLQATSLLCRKVNSSFKPLPTSSKVPPQYSVYFIIVPVKETELSNCRQHNALSVPPEKYPKFY